MAYFHRLYDCLDVWIRFGHEDFVERLKFRFVVMEDIWTLFDRVAHAAAPAVRVDERQKEDVIQTQAG
jgi:hypothetical protein